MRFMTPDEQRLMARLVEIAGSALLVEEAFATLNRAPEPPSLDAILRYILANRRRWHEERRTIPSRYDDPASQPAGAGV